MKCPHCQSDRIRRSRSTDSFVYRLLLVAKARCRTCAMKFLYPCWQLED